MLGSTVEVWDRSSEVLQSEHTCLSPVSFLSVYRVLLKVRLAGITAAGRVPAVVLIIEVAPPNLGYALQGLRYTWVWADTLQVHGHHPLDSCLAFGVEAHPLVLFFLKSLLVPFCHLIQVIQRFLLIATSQNPVSKPKCCGIDLFPLRYSNCCMHLLNPRLHLAMGVSGKLLSVHLPTDPSWVD